MESAEIRSRWLRFFAERGHTRRARRRSLLLDDPTLLFVNAGMVPFKPYFLGEAPPPWHRATSVQKCVRTLDIEEVGKTTRHGSFFQMNGNFSFGDYFKEGAIPFAWELVTRSQSDGGYGFARGPALGHRLPRRRRGARPLAQASSACRSSASSAAARRTTTGRMGVPGPGGPVLRDLLRPRSRSTAARAAPRSTRTATSSSGTSSSCRTSSARSARRGLRHPRRPAGEEHRHRAWASSGSPRSCRASTTSTRSTSSARSSTGRASCRGARYGADHDDDVRLRVVADHVRTGAMLIGDGVPPGNEGRGYVLRRLLRRVVRNMRLLGVDEPVLPELLDVAVAAMEPSYPELRRDVGRICAASPSPRRRPSRTPCAPARRSSTPRCRAAQRRLAARCRATRRSRCTTPTASRSTSPSRWRPRRASRSTRTASAGS